MRVKGIFSTGFPFEPSEAVQMGRRRATLRSRWRLCRFTDAAYPLRVKRYELLAKPEASGAQFAMSLLGRDSREVGGKGV